MPLLSTFAESPATSATPDAIDVSVCIANWNCTALLRKCLRSLFENPQGVQFEVIVVDNASADGAAEMIAAEFPQAVLIRNISNRGFAAASNQAAARARGRYLFFLNNDTEVPPLALAKLFDHAKANPAAGMFGPRLREPNGNVQISYRRRPTIAALLHKVSLVRWTGFFRKAYKDYRRGSFKADGTRHCGRVDGPGRVHRARRVRLRRRVGRALPLRRRGYRHLDPGGEVARQ